MVPKVLPEIETLKAKLERGVVGGAVVVRGGEKAAFLAHTATLAASLGSKKDQLRSEVPTRGLL